MQVSSVPLVQDSRVKQNDYVGREITETPIHDISYDPLPLLGHKDRVKFTLASIPVSFIQEVWLSLSEVNVLLACKQHH